MFASVGIFDSDASELSAALLRAAAPAEAQPGMVDSYGQRYIIDFDLARQGRTVRVRSSWIVLTGQDVPRVTTCYVR